MQVNGGENNPEAELNTLILSNGKLANGLCEVSKQVS